MHAPKQSQHSTIAKSAVMARSRSSRSEHAAGAATPLLAPPDIASGILHHTPSASDTPATTAPNSPRM